MTTASYSGLLPDQHPEQVAKPAGFFRRLLGRKLAVVCCTYLLVVVLVAIFAPILLPDVATENAGDLLAVRQGPSSEHWLGTDTLGRDVLDRLLVGTRVTVVGVAEALIVVLGVGVPIGLAAGFLGGRLERLVVWLADLTFAMPAIVIILVVLSVFPHSMLAGMVTLGLIAAPALMRVVRSATLPVREELYVAAARVAGLSRIHIMSRHVLPRIAGVVIVQASLLCAVSLLVQTGLSFLGLLVQAPAPSWGGMVADGVQALVLQPWLIWPPGIAIGLTILALGLLGDSVRDATTERWSRPNRSHRARRRGGAPAELHGEAVERCAHDASLLSIDGLTVTFPTPSGPVAVVEGVTFDIDPGETVGLVGETGCGKTVTGMSILGLLPGDGEVASGSIQFGPRNLTAMSEAQLREVRGRDIALISQEPMVSLDPTFTVSSQLTESLRRHRRLSRRTARAEAIELLRRVRLPDPEAVARRYPFELSGGMAQRVAIARALAGEPRLLIADEPTTALDVTVQAEILELIRDLQLEKKMAVLLITHDWGVVADICDRVVVMYAGQVVERASLKRIFDSPLHPYTKALHASNPNAGHVGSALPTIPGSVPKPGAWPSGCHFHPRCLLADSDCTSQSIPLVPAGEGRETRCIHYARLM